jgi:hypothetical protein
MQGRERYFGFKEIIVETNSQTEYFGTFSRLFILAKCVLCVESSGLVEGAANHLDCLTGSVSSCLCGTSLSSLSLLQLQHPRASRGKPCQRVVS